MPEKSDIEYTKEQVAEHERRQGVADKRNKRIAKVAEREGHETVTPNDVAAAAEPAKSTAGKGKSR